MIYNPPTPTPIISVRGEETDWRSRAEQAEADLAAARKEILRLRGLLEYFCSAKTLLAIKEGKCSHDEIETMRHSLVMELRAELANALGALETIAEGKGAYSRDPLIHASNTIDAMKATATAAIDAAKEDEPLKPP